jgi:putative DNA methylase
MRSADYNAKLSRWHPRHAGDKGEQIFSDQALNTLYNYCCRPALGLKDAALYNLKVANSPGTSTTQTLDCREIEFISDFWITDPPYADAVNYHELSELFLSWIGGRLPTLNLPFKDESRRALAVIGSDEKFRKSMVDSYSRLVSKMTDDGAQVVMFTHQSAAVWADLTLILWASGLRVTAAWNIATEVESKLKQGNYVKATVLLILRKQTSEDVAFLDEVYPEVEDEVKRQLDAMHALDDPHADAPDFGDTDYQLAAYAAALRVLTRYRAIEDIDVARELSRPRTRGQDPSPLEGAITNAVRIACDHLVPPESTAPSGAPLAPPNASTSRGSTSKVAANNALELTWNSPVASASATTKNSSPAPKPTKSASSPPPPSAKNSSGETKKASPAPSIRCVVFPYFQRK